MQYLHDLNISEDREVYPPSEDSILFVESLNISEGEKVLEIGCGSGVVSIHCALNGAKVSCGDINPYAVALTRKNAEQNMVDIIVRDTDLFSAFPEKYDTILFNLPYLPVEENEIEGELVRSWAGGIDGMGPFPRLLEEAPQHLLPGGRVVVVASSLMDKDKMDQVLEGRKVSVLGELPLFFEKLTVLEIR